MRAVVSCKNHTLQTIAFTKKAMTIESIGKLDYNEIVFPKLGIDIHLDSTAFSIGKLEIQWYGIIITLGVLLAIVYAFTQVKKYGLHPDRFLDTVIGGLIGGIIGARVYYVVMEWDNYAGDWKSIFNFREGGLAIYGGIIGGLLVGCLVAKLRKVKIPTVLDIAGIGFLLAQGIGRWGNFFNQEAFGCNTDSIFGMSGGRIQEWLTYSYPQTNFYTNFGKSIGPSLPVHPCFLYESLWCLLGFVLLAIFAKKIRRYDGQIFLMYIGWYGLERALVEGLRTDSLVIGNVRISQLLAISCVLASVILQIIIGLRVKRLGTDYQLYKDTEESRRMLEEYEKQKVERPESGDASDTEEASIPLENEVKTTEDSKTELQDDKNHNEEE